MAVWDVVLRAKSFEFISLALKKTEKYKLYHLIFEFTDKTCRRFVILTQEDPRAKLEQAKQSHLVAQVC